MDADISTRSHSKWVYYWSLNICHNISRTEKNTKRGLLQSLKYESIWQMEHLKLKMPVGKEYLYVTLNHKTSHK